MADRGRYRAKPGVNPAMAIGRRREAAPFAAISLAAVACGGTSVSTLETSGTADLDRGKGLFEANCARCHGQQA